MSILDELFDHYVKGEGAAYDFVLGIKEPITWPEKSTKQMNMANLDAQSKVIYKILHEMTPAETEELSIIEEVEEDREII